MSAKLYGKVLYEERTPPRSRRARPCWVVECEPYVMTRLKRHFPRADAGQRGELVLVDSPETCRDLDAFLYRFPMEVSERERLLAGANAHAERERQVHAILSGQATGDTGGFSGGGLQQLTMALALPPRPYQETAAKLLWTVKRLLLADELGLGKSYSALYALTNPALRPALVLAPTHLVGQWAEYAARFIPGMHTRVLRTGDPLKESPTRWRGKTVPLPDLMITSHGRANGWADVLAPLVRCVVVDEAHELRGDPHGVRNKAIRYLLESVPYALGLSATPVFNYGGEIFRVIDALSPGALGSEEEFLREWCDRVDLSKAQVTDARALGRHLRDAGLLLRRTRKDVGRELPGLSWVPVPVPADLSVIQAAEDQAAELARIIIAQSGFSGFERRSAARDLDTKMRQATGIAKAPYVAEMVRGLVHSREDGTHEPVLLTGWHREVYRIWTERLADLNPCLFTGSESARQKEEAKQRFLSGESKVLIMSNRSGAGLDGLQAVCNTVVVGEPDWANGVHVQISGRPYRDGQTRPVTVYFPLADVGSDPIVADVAGVKSEQLSGLNDPDAPLEEEVVVDDDRMKRLAEAILSRRQRAAA